MATWSEIRTEIENSYDLAEEVFVTPQELMNIANEAIDDIEAEIHSIHEKYFETSTPLALVKGQSEYSKPSDMYANKVTGIYYDDGTIKYEIKPLKNKAEIAFIKPEDRYRYAFVNSTVDGIKIKLYPASREDASSNATIYYIRQAKKFTADADELDIPEGRAFIKQYVVDYASDKERMTPDAAESPALKRKRTLLIDVLSSMREDDNSEILPDTDFVSDIFDISCGGIY